MVSCRLDDTVNVWMEQKEEPCRTADYDNDPRRIAQRLSIIRKAMSAALRRKDAASPEIKAAWELARTTK
jgi:hypothetical protein